nr:hypothetical protein [bacterium]
SRGLVMDTQLVASALAVNDAALYTQENGGVRLTLEDNRVAEMLGILSDGVGAGDFLVRNPSGQQANLFYDVWHAAQSVGDEKGNLHPDKWLAVPLPAGPSSKQPVQFCVWDSYYMIGAGSPNPEIGYAWLWYIGNFCPEPYSPFQDYQSGNLPEALQHTQVVFDLFENLLEYNEQLVAPGAMLSIDGVKRAFEQLYGAMFEGKMSYAQAVESYGPAMRRALEQFEMQAVPDVGGG